MERLFLKKAITKARNLAFPGSAIYWERRYKNNGNSGNGSYGSNAEYKAGVLNRFVAVNNIKTVIEFGCGDGNQAKQFDFPDYTGLDVSATAIEKCTQLFKQDPAKHFFIADKRSCALRAELALSLDVIYHLVEEEVYETYMNQLFAAATKFVIIYAWDVESDKNFHVKHRKFSEWINENVPAFKLFDKIHNATFSDFYIYQRINPR